jgi:hypothetical protein
MYRPGNQQINHMPNTKELFDELLNTVPYKNWSGKLHIEVDVLKENCARLVKKYETAKEYPSAGTPSGNPVLPTGSSPQSDDRLGSGDSPAKPSEGPKDESSTLPPGLR